MATRASAFSTLVLFAATGSAADRRLLSLVMPDVEVLAGVNVRGAAASPLGRYVLGAMMQRSQQFQQATTNFGLDPRSFRELLVASNSLPRYDAGLALVRGSFQPSAVIAKAVSRGGLTEKYKNVTLVTDPKHTLGLAFLGSGIMITGDVASVRTAIDRSETPSTLPAPLSARIAQLSAAQDAWMVSTVPASRMLPASAARAGASRGIPAQNILQNVQSVSGGVKFGKLATLSAVAQADTPQTAQLLASTVKLMMNLLQAQGQQVAADTASSLVADADGSVLNVSFHLTDPEFRRLSQMLGNYRGAAPNTAK